MGECMMVRVSGFLPASRFGAGDLSNRPTPEQRAEDFQKGLKTLIETDSKRIQPVFKRINADTLVLRIKNFMARQAEAGRNPLSFLVGLSGGSCSGKSTLMYSLKESFQKMAGTLFQWKSEVHGPVVDVLEVDHYYHDLSQRRKELGDERFFQETNLDEPQALTLDQAQKDLMKIRNGMAVRTPVYDFTNSSRHEGAALRVPSPFFIYEGLFTLAHEPLRKLADLKIFVDADAKVRGERYWARAPQRNIKPDKGGWGLFNRMMEMHEKHVQPSISEADVVVDGSLAKTTIDEAVSPLVQLLTKTLYPQGIPEKPGEKTPEKPTKKPTCPSLSQRFQAILKKWVA